MATVNNLAAWQLAAKGDLVVQEAPMYTVNEGEVLIKVSHLRSCPSSPEPAQ